MRASLREPESVPRSCGVWAERRGCRWGGGYVYTLTPAFWGSRLPVWNHFLPLWPPLRGLQCDTNAKDRAICMFLRFWKKKIISRFWIFAAALPLTPLILCAPPPSPRDTPSPVSPRVLQSTPRPTNKQRARCIANDGKQLGTHKETRPAIPLRAIFRLYFEVKWLEPGYFGKGRGVMGEWPAEEACLLFGLFGFVKEDVLDNKPLHRHWHVHP